MKQLLAKLIILFDRAEFDVYRSSCDNSQHLQKQVFVSCNFCGKSIAYNMLATRNRHFMFGGTMAHKPKVSNRPTLYSHVLYTYLTTYSL